MNQDYFVEKIKEIIRKKLEEVDESVRAEVLEGVIQQLRFRSCLISEEYINELENTPLKEIEDEVLSGIIESRYLPV